MSSSITPWYLEIIKELHNFLWVLHQLLFLTDYNFPGFWVVVNREYQKLNRVRITIKQLLVISFAYEFVLDHVIPSLLGYIIILMILTVLPGPYSRSTTFGDELSLRRSSLSYRFALNNKLGFEFVSYPWFE